MSQEEYYKKVKYKKIGGFRKRAILDFAIKKYAKILDIGCSTGLMGALLKERFDSEVYGTEISQEVVDVANQSLKKVFLLDLTKEKVKLPTEIEKIEFDYIIISEVLEHLFEPKNLLENLKCIISKKTEIIITVPNLLFWKNRCKILKGNFNYTKNGLMDKGHIYFFTWISLNSMIEKTGYEVVEVNNHIPTRGTKWLGKIFPGLFSYQFILKIRKKRKVIYTAIFGDYDNLLEPKIILKDFDYVCFTDQNFKSDIWQVRKIKPEYEDMTKNARKIKLLPHKYLPRYDISVWIDGNMIIRGNIGEAVNKYLSKNNIALYDHSCLPSGEGRHCLYKEAEILINMYNGGKKKDDPFIIKKQISKYKQERYPENNGLFSTMVIYRRHNKKDVVKAMNEWWEELSNNSKRDQLSLNYVIWKNKLNFKLIKENSRDNKYFLNIKHKK